MNKSFLAIAVTASLSSYASFSLAQEQAPSSTTDDTMVVTANRFDKVDAATLSPTIVVTKQDISRLQAQSLVDVFRTLPSIEVAQYGGRGQNASIFVRGGSSSQVLVLVDGIRMPRAMMGGVDFNQVPVSGIERIEFIRGARASIYGSEAIAGVINIITRADMNDETKKIQAGFGSNNHHLVNGAFSSAISEDKHIKAILGYEKTDGYNVKPIPGVNDGDEHGFESYNAQFAYQQRFNQNLNGYISATAYNNEYGYDSSKTWITPPEHQKKKGHIEYRGVNGNLAYVNSQLASAFDFSYGTQDNYDFNAEDSKESGGHVSIEQTTASWLNSYKFDNQLSVGAGVDFRREKLLKEDFYKPTENPRDNVGLSGLAQYQINTVTLEGSVRSDDNSQYGRHNTWQTALGWAFYDGYELTTSYGTAFRAPSFVDLYYPGSEAPDLKPEDSKNFQVSLQGLNQYIDWRLTAYKNQINNMLIWDNTVYKVQNIGEAEITGIELELNFDTSLVHHQIYLDFKDPVDKSKDEEQQLAYRAKKGLKWNAYIELDQWTLGTQYLYQGERFNGTTRLDSYSLWNFTAEYQVISDFKVQGKLSNAFDKEYEMYTGYVSPGRQYFVSATYSF